MKDFGGDSLAYSFCLRLGTLLESKIICSVFKEKFPFVYFYCYIIFVCVI